MLWSSIVPSKISFFAWRLLHNFMPLDPILQNKGIPLVSRCACCHKQVQNMRHLFLEGPVAQQVWNHFETMFGIAIQPHSCVSTLLMSWILSPLKLSAEHIRCAIPLPVLCFIWNSRNQECFQGGEMRAQQIIADVDNLIAQIGAANFMNLSISSGWKIMTVSCHKPSTHCFKLNTEASVVRGLAVGGGVLRDHNENMIFAYYKEFGEGEAIMTEALVLSHGLHLCQQKGIQSIVVEVDSSLLVHLIESEAIANWPLCNILRRTRSKLKALSASIIYIFKEGNSVADCLTGLQLGHDQFYSDVSQVPTTVRAKLILDAVVVPPIRFQNVKE